MNTTIIAVDPGQSGGIAIRHHFVQAVELGKMPETPTDICRIIQAAQSDAMLHAGNAVAYMEQVGGYVGGDGAPGSAMWNFGRGFGQIEGILIALRIRLVLVRPQVWQKGLGLGTTGIIRGNYTGMADVQRKEEKKRIARINAQAKRDWKNKLKATAQRLYPTLNVTLDTCDALLILEYAMRQCGREASICSMDVQPSAAI